MRHSAVYCTDLASGTRSTHGHYSQSFLLGIAKRPLHYLRASLNSVGNSCCGSVQLFGSWTYFNAVKLTTSATDWHRESQWKTVRVSMSECCDAECELSYLRKTCRHATMSRILTIAGWLTRVSCTWPYLYKIYTYNTTNTATVDWRGLSIYSSHLISQLDYRKVWSLHACTWFELH